MAAKSKSVSLKIGLLILLSCFCLNVVFAQLNVGGLLRELSRGGVLVGLLLTVFGFILYLARRSERT